MADQSLVDALAAGVLGVALFCAGRLVLGALWRRPVERDVDVTHVVMGVSMAGMLTGWSSGGWNGVWLVAFTASTCWFVWRARGELHRPRAVPDLPRNLGDGAGGGHLPHLVASVTMLYMLVAMRWREPAGWHGMTAGMGPMSSNVAGSGTPILALAVAGLLVLDASISAGSVLLRPALAAPGPAVASSSESAMARAVRPLAPRGTAACTLVMSVAMAYMLVAAHP